MTALAELEDKIANALSCHFDIDVKAPILLKNDGLPYVYFYYYHNEDEVDLKIAMELALYSEVQCYIYELFGKLMEFEKDTYVNRENPLEMYAGGIYAVVPRT